MRRILPLLLVLALIGCVTPPEHGENPVGTWRASLDEEDGSVELRLTVNDRDNYWRSSLRLGLDELDGYDARTFKRVGADLELTWRREAGTFRLQGKGGWLFRPSGTFEFVPDTGYLARLDELGYESLKPRELLLVAKGDVTPEMIESIHSLGYSGVSLSELARLARQGVEPEYLRTARELDGEVTLDDVLRLRSHGVSSETLSGYIAEGLTPAPAKAVIRLYTHGVDPAYAAAVGSGELDDEAVDRVITLHNHGLSVAYVDNARGAGLRNDDDREIIRLHNHGVGETTLLGYVETGIDDVDDILRVYTHGITPDAAAALKAAGLQDASVDELIRLRNHGIDGAFVSRLADSGHDDLSVEELIEIKNRGLMREDS